MNTQDRKLYINYAKARLEFTEHLLTKHPGLGTLLIDQGDLLGYIKKLQDPTCTLKQAKDIGERCTGRLNYGDISGRANHVIKEIGE